MGGRRDGQEERVGTVINPQELAEAVSHWLRFEQLCRRRVLFNERYMAHTIGQYLIGVHADHVRIEVPHPKLSKKRIDFAICADDDSELVDVIETKLVSANRDFRQEIYDDLVRLELANPYLMGGAAWLLIAGLGVDIKKWVVSDGSDAEAEVPVPGPLIEGDGFVILSDSNPVEPAPAAFPFQGILAPFSSDDPITVAVQASAGEVRHSWKKAFESCNNEGPASFITHLEGRWLFDDAIDDERWNCMVWRISSEEPRVTITSADLAPQV